MENVKKYLGEGFDRGMRGIVHFGEDEGNG